MAQMKQAKIMIGRCNDKRPFAIRVEYKNNDWVRTWAFALSERMLKNERYGEEKITGSFYATREYPGCPYCGARNFVSCGRCGKWTYYNGEQVAACSWCGNTAETVEGDSFTADSNAF